MRAVWLDQIKSEEEHVLKGDALHHLLNVVRIEAGEELLLLDGRGLTVKGRVTSISKRELIVKQLEASQASRKYELDLALGMPKREALELSLKEAVELGFRRIFLVRSDYSQMKMPELDRLQRVLISAVEQSNAPFLPELIEASWESVPWQEHALNLLMDSQTNVVSMAPKAQASGSRLLVVGPEGGFSPEELQYLHARPQLEVLALPTPILRTPTAVAAGAGVLLQRLMD